LDTDEDARPMATKYLTKYRPGFEDRVKKVEDEGADVAEKKSNCVGGAIAI
jgi:hypothetical protein